MFGINRPVTLYIVQDDDDDRERVMKCRVGSFEANEFHSNGYDMPKYSITVDVLPMENGTYFSMENFNEEDDE